MKKMLLAVIAAAFVSPAFAQAPAKTEVMPADAKPAVAADAKPAKKKSKRAPKAAAVPAEKKAKRAKKKVADAAAPAATPADAPKAQ